MALRIDDDFFAGSIDVLRAPSRGDVELALRPDSAADVRQWFAFDVKDDALRTRDLVVRGVGEATYPDGFVDYEAMVSYDGDSWTRAPTQYDGSDLIITHEPRQKKTRYAYFAPYSMRRLEKALAKLAHAVHCDVAPIVSSTEGRPVYVASLGPEDAARTVWIIAAQHPGETPALWFMHGLMKRLRRGDAAVRQLLGSTRLCLAPLVNPDGAARGNMRTSATGANLNRCWVDPDPEEACEVAALLERMDATGVDLFLDVHADEECSYAFPAGCEGNPSFDVALADAEGALRGDLAASFAEFLDEPFYELDAPGEAELTCAANQIGERHGAVSLTLELPMKGDGGGRVRAGWSPKRAVKAGESLVDVLLRARARLDET
jgi:murein tripeptide amidase MpaA